MLTGAEDEYVQVEKEVDVVEEVKEGDSGEGAENGKQVIVPVKEDLSQLALLGQTVSNRVWNGVESVRRGIWGLAGWA